MFNKLKKYQLAGKVTNNTPTKNIKLQDWVFNMPEEGDCVGEGCSEIATNLFSTATGENKYQYIPTQDSWYFRKAILKNNGKAIYDPLGEKKGSFETLPSLPKDVMNNMQNFDIVTMERGANKSTKKSTVPGYSLADNDDADHTGIIVKDKKGQFKIYHGYNNKYQLSNINEDGTVTLKAGLISPLTYKVKAILRAKGIEDYNKPIMQVSPEDLEIKPEDRFDSTKFKNLNAYETKYFQSLKDEDIKKIATYTNSSVKDVMNAYKYGLGVINNETGSSLKGSPTALNIKRSVANLAHTVGLKDENASLGAFQMKYDDLITDNKVADFFKKMDIKSSNILNYKEQIDPKNIAAFIGNYLIKRNRLKNNLDNQYNEKTGMLKNNVPLDYAALYTHKNPSTNLNRKDKNNVSHLTYLQRADKDYVNSVIEYLKNKNVLFENDPLLSYYIFNNAKYNSNLKNNTNLINTSKPPNTNIAITPTPTFKSLVPLLKTDGLQRLELGGINNQYKQYIDSNEWEFVPYTNKFQQGGLYTTNPTGYIDSTLNANKNLNFVQRLYDKNSPSIKLPNEQYPSTHLMESGDSAVYPRIVMKDGKLQNLGDNAWKYARQTGEQIKFPNDEIAKWFGKNYKRGTGVLSKYQQGGKTKQTQPPITNRNFLDKTKPSKPINQKEFIKYFDDEKKYKQAVRNRNDSSDLFKKGKDAFIKYDQDTYVERDYKPSKIWGIVKPNKKQVKEALESTTAEVGYGWSPIQNYKDRISLLKKSLKTGIYPTNMLYPERSDPNLIYKKPVVIPKLKSKSIIATPLSVGQPKPELGNFTESALPNIPQYEMQGRTPIYGPGNSLLGMLGNDNTFYPDYNNTAARTKINQADNDMIGNEEALRQLLKRKGVNNPIIQKFNSGGLIKRADGSYSKRGLWDTKNDWEIIG